MWNYAPTNINPVVASTWIISLRKFIESELWWHGLQFLLLEKEKWLVHDVNVELKDLLVEDELKKSNGICNCRGQ